MRALVAMVVMLAAVHAQYAPPPPYFAPPPPIFVPAPNPQYHASPYQRLPQQYVPRQFAPSFAHAQPASALFAASTLRFAGANAQGPAIAPSAATLRAASRTAQRTGEEAPSAENPVVSADSSTTWSRAVDAADRTAALVGNGASYAHKALRVIKSAPSLRKHLKSIGGKAASVGQAVSLVKAFGSGSDADLDNGSAALGSLVGGGYAGAVLGIANSAADALGAPKAVKGSLEVASELVPSTVLSKMLGFVARSGKRIVRGDMRGLQEVLDGADSGDSGNTMQGIVKLTNLVTDMATGKGFWEAVRRSTERGQNTTVSRAGEWLGEKAVDLYYSQPVQRSLAATKDGVRRAWNSGARALSGTWNRLLGRRAAPTATPTPSAYRRMMERMRVTTATDAAATTPAVAISEDDTQN